MSAGKSRVLVTGGAGLIGSHLVDLLVEQGYEVTILDSLEHETHPKGEPEWINRRARFIKGDVRSDSDLENALQGVRAVFHQAAVGGVNERAARYLEVNAIGTAKIFELIQEKRLPVEKVVVASSQAVYGEGAAECAKHGDVFPPMRSLEQLRSKLWEHRCPRCGDALRPRPTQETKPRDSEAPYGLSKELQERLALACGKRLGIPVVALRYAVTYGPRQSLFNPYTGVVSIFSTRLLNDLPPLVYEDGRQERDFIYVADVARANVFAMESERTNGEVFNVSTGRGITLLELVRTLGQIYGKRIEPHLPGEFRPGDVRHIVLDPSKLNASGFRASTSLSEGLRLFGEWIKTQGPIREYFGHAYEDLKKKRIVVG